LSRQIIFSTEHELRDKPHIIDYDVPPFFCQIIQYYPEFESALSRNSEAILQSIQKLSDTNAKQAKPLVQRR
jgi:CTP synthase (UTP-ammonia lyase)